MVTTSFEKYSLMQLINGHLTENPFTCSGQRRHRQTGVTEDGQKGSAELREALVSTKRNCNIKTFRNTSDNDLNFQLLQELTKGKKMRTFITQNSFASFLSISEFSKWSFTMITLTKLMAPHSST